MAFFTSDIKVAETFANPQVQQVIGPGAGRAWSGDMGSAQGMLSELGRSTQQGSGAFNYNIPSAQQLWSQVSVGSGVTAGMLGDTATGTTTTGDVLPTPITVDDTITSTQPVEYGDDFQPMPTTVDDTQASEFDLRNYLENRGMYQFGAGLLGSMMGGLPLGIALDAKAGINPFSHIGPLRVGSTYLDHFGELAGITSEQLGGVEWGDLPASEQRDMLVEQLMFNEQSEEGVDRTWMETIGDWWSDLTDTGYDPDMDLTTGDWTVYDPVAPELEFGDSSDFDEGGNLSDWTEEEFEDDFGMDDFGDLSDWGDSWW